jgi:hypothetical protein
MYNKYIKGWWGVGFIKVDKIINTILIIIF